MLEKHKEQLNRYRNNRLKLSEIGIEFCDPDKYFSEFDLETKRMFNDVGKILLEIERLLAIYEHTNKEDKKADIRWIFAKIQAYINNTVKL